MKDVYTPDIATVKGDTAWSALEQDLLDECSLGRMACLPEKLDLPADQSDLDRRVRAGLIRYLMLGGCESDHPDSCRPHPKGVRLSGAWIDGALDLEACVSRLDLVLGNCRFDQDITLRDAEIGGLILNGCLAVQTVNLHRLQTEAGVMLRNGFEA